MWRARPIFISGTSLDMQAERAHLRSYVFPELEERLRACRQNLEWVDLRIGVAITSLEEEDVRELQVLIGFSVLVWHLAKWGFVMCHNK
jgi:hypothetical protein